MKIILKLNLLSKAPLKKRPNSFFYVFCVDDKKKTRIENILRKMKGKKCFIC